MKRKRKLTEPSSPSVIDIGNETMNSSANFNTTNENISTLSIPESNVTNCSKNQGAERPVTLCSVAVSDSANGVRRIQVWSDHQLPVERLLKADEWS